MKKNKIKLLIIFPSLVFVVFLFTANHEIKADIVGSNLMKFCSIVEMNGISHGQVYKPGDSINFAFKVRCSGVRSYNSFYTYPKDPCRCAVRYPGDEDCTAYFWTPPAYHNRVYLGDPWDTYPPNPGCTDYNYNKICDVWEIDDGDQCEPNGYWYGWEDLRSCFASVGLSGDSVGGYTISARVEGQFRNLGGGVAECEVANAVFEFPNVNSSYNLATVYINWSGLKKTNIEYSEEIESYRKYSDGTWASPSIANIKKVNSYYDIYAHTLNMGTFGEHITVAFHSCSLPWGGTITSGSSVTAYLASSVPCGSTCSSQTRTCSNGTLSGSYTKSSCSVGACPCPLPWGGTITSGSSVTAYLASSVPCGSSCSSQTRTCSNGTLSGSYTKSSCSVGACPCSLPWGGTITSGSSVTAYLASSVPCGSTCSSQTRTCSNGTLSGSYTKSSCSVGACTLSVSLISNPLSGNAPLNDVDLTATVDGTQIGTINYTFYCDRSDSGTNITSGWAAKFDGINDNPKTAVDVCDYAPAGTYTAKVIVERGSLITENRRTITVDPPLNSSPTVGSLLVLKGDYCTNPAHYFSWTYSDNDGDKQSQLQIQLDKEGDFVSPEFDSGQVPVGDYTCPNDTCDNENNRVVQVDYNNTYYWRVKVWDSQGADSGWVNGTPFTSGEHRYPSPGFTWSPKKPSVGEDVQFTDESECYTLGGATVACASWQWTFGDATPSDSTDQNPIVQFNSSGSHQVGLRVIDPDGNICPLGVSYFIEVVGVKWKLPGWREILPW